MYMGAEQVRFSVHDRSAFFVVPGSTSVRSSSSPNVAKAKPIAVKSLAKTWIKEKHS